VIDYVIMVVIKGGSIDPNIHEIQDSHASDNTILHLSATDILLYRYMVQNIWRFR